MGVMRHGVCLPMPQHASPKLSRTVCSLDPTMAPRRLPAMAQGRRPRPRLAARQLACRRQQMPLGGPHRSAMHILLQAFSERLTHVRQPLYISTGVCKIDIIMRCDDRLGQPGEGVMGYASQLRGDPKIQRLLCRVVCRIAPTMADHRLQAAVKCRRLPRPRTAAQRRRCGCRLTPRRMRMTKGCRTPRIRRRRTCPSSSPPAWCAPTRRLSYEGW